VKILLDACVTGKAKVEIQRAGHDVIWSGDWEQDPGDEAILETAFREGRVLVTIDKDFGELAVLRGASHCGILRLVNFRAAQQAYVCAQVLATHSTDLEAGAIITVEPGRMRIRRRPG
jgi:predicted nuclease of predicted toxin-antitoxin system